jgi:hypothetical protein
MKTINEAATTYADSLRVSDCELSAKQLEEYAILDFKAGVFFAQKWISVDEAKPIKQGCYFVKCKTSFPKNCDVVVAEYYEDNQMFYSESSDSPIYDATHWRPIDFS